jgi:chromosome segregation ATPase
MDVLKSSQDEAQRKRDEAQFYSIQQQIDDLRRQFKETLARQQWFEELYRQSEGKVQQLQMAQDRLSQDVAQTLHARQIDEGRVKVQLADLAQKVENPEKQIRELKALISEVTSGIKSDRDVDAADRKQVEDIQRQIREIYSSMSLLTDAQRQLRDLIQELDAAIGEVRNEALHVAELQRVEEQRLRRQGVELQELFETLRQQFGEVAAKSQRVDDVRRQMVERIEAVEEEFSNIRGDGDTVTHDIERLEKMTTEQYIVQQNRLEAVRTQIDSQLAEMRQMADQRMDRYMNRFTGVDERIRSLEQMLSEIPSRFEALERRDETIGAEADSIEEWLVLRQLEALEGVLEEVRKRRSERASVFNSNSQVKPASAPGSVYNPAGLLKSVRDAKPPSKPKMEVEEESDE